MNTKIRNILSVVLLLGFVLIFAVWGVMKPDDLISDRERRPLAGRPELTLSGLKNGSYMTKYETYSADQFPLRDGFSKLKIFTALDVFRQKDVNGFYSAQGHAAQLDYPLNEASVGNAAKKLSYIYDKYLSDKNVNVYISVIPDKNSFLAAPNGYPAFDFAELTMLLRSDTDSFSEYIEIGDTLTLESFYRTDAHWRQETLLPTAERIAEALGADIATDYTTRLLDKPFRGVYSGKTDLSLDTEELYYLDSAVLSACRVYDYETEKYLPVYDLEKASGRDAYELFLSGAKSLLRIENPSADSDRRLIIFRDSFGSSLAPLLVPGYSEVTLVDIRYIASARLGSLIDFDNADVLFLYSAGVLNNSETLK